MGELRELYRRDRGARSAILRKDLRIEVRTRESVPAMALFSVTVFVLFHFGLRPPNTLEGDLASGVFGSRCCSPACWR